MDESIKILPNFKKFNSYIDDVKQGISPIMLSGLTTVNLQLRTAFPLLHVSTEVPETGNVVIFPLESTSATDGFEDVHAKTSPACFIER